MARPQTGMAPSVAGPVLNPGEPCGMFVVADSGNTVSGLDAADPGRIFAERYVALDEERRQLSLAWQDVETWLFKNRSWPSLTDAQQSAIPEAARLEELEAQVASIDQQHEVLLPALTTTPACTRAGVFARLDVLVCLLTPHANEDAKVLLESCRADLKRLWR